MEKKPILDIMVDLETASTKEDAAILSWAMVPFDRENKRYGFDYFYKLVNMTSCFMAGMDVDKGTQQWWQAPSVWGNGYSYSTGRYPLPPQR